MCIWCAWNAIPRDATKNQWKNRKIVEECNNKFDSFNTFWNPRIEGIAAFLSNTWKLFHFFWSLSWNNFKTFPVKSSVQAKKLPRLCRAFIFKRFGGFILFFFWVVHPSSTTHCNYHKKFPLTFAVKIILAKRAEKICETTPTTTTPKKSSMKYVFIPPLALSAPYHTHDPSNSDFCGNFLLSPSAS